MLSVCRRPMCIWSVQSSRVVLCCVVLCCVVLCCVVLCCVSIIGNEVGLKAVLTTHVCSTMFHGLIDFEAVLTAHACHIMPHGPCVVHVSFTSAAFEAVVTANIGHIVFHGPREDVVEFFESCGFCCPERKGVPDFLQEVTSKNDQKVSLLLHSALQNLAQRFLVMARHCPAHCQYMLCYCMLYYIVTILYLYPSMRMYSIIALCCIMWCQVMLYCTLSSLTL